MSRAGGYLVLLLGVLAVGAAGWWLDREDGGAEAPAERPPYRLPVTLVEVHRGRVAPSLQLTGTVRPERSADLAFEQGGTVREVLVDAGDAPREGDVLARLDDRDQRLGLAAAEADLAVARRQLELLEAGERGEVTARLQAEVEGARADEELATLEVNRLENLRDGAIVSRTEIDRARARLRVAEARSEVAAQRLAEARQGARAEELAVARARVDVASAALERAHRELEKTELLAPWDGSVVWRARSAGDTVAAGEPVLQLFDLEHLEVVVEVPAREGARLAQDPPVVLTLDEAPGLSLATRVTARVEAADTVSRNFRGLVRLDLSRETSPLAARLRPGMFVRAELALAALEDVLVLPSDAIRLTESGPVVVVADPVEDGLQGRWVPVRLLGAEDTAAAVEPLEGELDAGDRVVLTGVDLAYPGVALQPRDPGGESP